MFIRKPKGGLTREDLKALFEADHRAKTLGCPLNTLVTVKACYMKNLTIEALCREFVRIRNNYDAFARRRQFEPAFVWTREIAPNNTGEHMHMKCHVPPRLLRRFATRAQSWLPCPKEIDVEKADLYEYLADDGKRHSSLLYIAKQMTPQAVFRTNLRRKKGGTIMGRRWYASRNLLPEKARPE